jgi:hypothetical protein
LSKYQAKYSDNYKAHYITGKIGSNEFQCSACGSSNTLSKSGKEKIENHIKRKAHLENVAEKNRTVSMSSFIKIITVL